MKKYFSQLFYVYWGFVGYASIYEKFWIKEEGIPTMVYYPIPLHKQIVYKDYSFNLEDLKVAENLCDCVLSIPMHPYLTEEKIETVCDAIKKTIKEYRN